MNAESKSYSPCMPLWFRVFCILPVFFFLPSARAQNPSFDLEIPPLERAPTLEDFPDMKPVPEMEGKLKRVTDFLQKEPSDGQPSTQRTEAYLGFDRQNLYVVFVAFDSDAKQIRARMVPRESFMDEEGYSTDDNVTLCLDTFGDQLRGYLFSVNPHGIQWDALATEGSHDYDTSFDALWYSRGKLTDKGYMVWISIPFRSLRFPPESRQKWGLMLRRDIPRANEVSFWPAHTTRIAGFWNQAASLTGLQDISPGRNLQLIPYGSFRNFRTLDTTDPVQPEFVSKRHEFDGGVDAKMVLRDSLVLDVAINPDFSQVESDEPQTTVNERFEVFYPEKRPFFIENAGYFQTPNNLLFTRRIADPQFGARLTGKIGRYAVGALVADDQSPGRSVTADDPLHGKRALFTVARISREIGKQSSIGVIFTDREFDRSYNRVGGVDARFRLGQNWTTEAQAVTSSTRDLDGRLRSGPAYDFSLNRSGRQFNYSLQYNDRSENFETEPGYMMRPDVRNVAQEIRYEFRPEGNRLISWGPALMMEQTWDHAGNHLNWLYVMDWSAEFTGKTYLSLFFAPEFEQFRPEDFPGISRRRSYRRQTTGLHFSTSYWKHFDLQGEYNFGRRVNITPLVGQDPELAGRSSGEITLSLHPSTSLRIDNTYILFRLYNPSDGSSIFNNHIVRTKWNWQWNRELSFRAILQYDAILANPARTSLSTTKNVNLDFLLTYMLHPGTALHLGYNTNLQNIALVPFGNRTEILRTNEFLNDSRGLFLKLSYLFRF